ncbi:MAG: ATP-dependent helicase [archaeon]|nr:ATP-dependent helicase [archaeon]
MKIELTQAQKNVVTYDNKKFLSVEAGPGAGKTLVLIEKVKFMLNNLNIDPESLLIITFSNKAAFELQERLTEGDIPKSDIQKMQISTIHSFCINLLEKNGDVGYDIIADDYGEKVNMFVGKHLNDLGFINEFYLPVSQVRDVVHKYNEYCTFNVDSDKLVDYISKTRPIDDEYIEFIYKYLELNDGAFPRKEVMDNEIYKKSWYNAKYLQIARSYPIYLKLLEKEHAIDFGQMQTKALEILKKNPRTKYTNILIDEFQDTDPIQMDIFEQLMKHADSFTVVGDINQSIYGFRGSTLNYFKYLHDYHEDKFDFLSLDTNYRSTEEIIDISEDFIKHQRDDTSKLGKPKCGRNVNCPPVYYLINENEKIEALNIFNIIKYLKSNNKVKNYADIGILSRSVKGSSRCIKYLIELLEENDISYQIKGLNDLIKKDEIKSILTLLFHLVSDDDPESYMMNKWQLDWLNLKAYTGANFNQILFELSDETKTILNNIQDEFEKNVLETEKIVYNEFTNKKSRIKKFTGVFKRDDEILEEIFKRVEKPILSDENLNKYGITNQNDLMFFKRLNELKYKCISDDVKFFDRPTISNVYLELLTDITGFLTEDKINVKNDDCIRNIASITSTFSNYEEMRYERDLRGVFWFIYRTIEDYESYHPDEDGVQIMTVHKSKGLEFPVVILASLNEKGFPLEFKEPNPENGYINGKPVYYTPDSIFRYSKFEIDEDGLSPEEIEKIKKEKEKEAHISEEERIIYVAMTRAQDTLILSSIVKDCEDSRQIILEGQNSDKFLKSITKGPYCIQNVINMNLDYCKLIDPNNIKINTIPREQKEDDEYFVHLSFTALENYQECPFKYKMSNELNFNISQRAVIDDGIFIHKSFEIINKEIMANDNSYIGDERVIKTIEKLFKKDNFNLLEEKPDKYKSKLNSITRDILYYYKNYGSKIKILDSEYSFYLKNKHYALSGVVDLICIRDGKLVIVDYKNTALEKKYAEKHKKQLHLYVLALRDQNQKYEEKTIDEAEIYAIKSKKVLKFKIDEELLKELENELNEVALRIKNGDFSSKKCDNCEYCQYSKICNQ